MKFFELNKIAIILYAVYNTKLIKTSWTDFLYHTSHFIFFKWKENHEIIAGPLR